ncbi:hypothetical protein [Brucella pseudogrignonensis]|uniref:hypothetical protein n=1 Tax=Brucella pseudogrignonensis TaxID=419475 RepID=UPI003ECCC608
MSDSGWQTPNGVIFGANAMFNFRLCAALVEQGVLTQQQAANVMVETAEDIRSGSEDGIRADLGEALASRYEVFAGWLLGTKTTL